VNSNWKVSCRVAVFHALQLGADAGGGSTKYSQRNRGEAVKNVDNSGSCLKYSQTSRGRLYNIIIIRQKKESLLNFIREHITREEQGFRKFQENTRIGCST
jgi:hypothetical protein